METAKEIQNRILDSEMYRKADVILSYSAIRSEVETELFHRMVLAQGKSLYLPKTYPNQKRMSFYRVTDLARLQSGYQGILEPPEEGAAEVFWKQKKENQKEKILMIMPGAAFDDRGNRLGYGGGYYDRYLSEYGECFTTVLIAFEEQKTARIPEESCDIKPDYILTQQGFKNYVGTNPE
jgi:5-formyltetrahydrofolate cyclo-ligase